MRADVVAVAVEATKSKRYVPFAVCLTCVRHVYPEQHKPAFPDHLVETLRADESAEVARIHKATEDTLAAQAKAFVESLRQKGGKLSG